MDTKHVPTNDDPFCECGHAKHDHHGGTGALALENARVTCARFRLAKDGPAPRALSEGGDVMTKDGNPDEDFAAVQDRGDRRHRRDGRR